MSGPSASALELSEKLTDTGWYHWKPINEDYTVYLRTPKEYEGCPPWLDAEQPELIHVCDTEKLMEAYRGRNKEDIARYCGYVRDDTCQVCAIPV